MPSLCAICQACIASIKLETLVLLLFGAWMLPAASQNLKTTCPLVKAATCIGTCSSKAPSYLRSGTCSTRKRGLLEIVLHSSMSLPAGHAASSTTSAQPPAPPKTSAKPDWKLQPAAPALPSSTKAAAAGTAAGAAEGPPQRYLPYGMHGSEPPESPEEEAAIIQHLDIILSHPDNISHTSSPPPPSPSAPAAAAAVGKFEGPPQKYFAQDGSNSSQPVETQEQQEEIVHHLDDVISHPDNTTTTDAGETVIYTAPANSAVTAPLDVAAEDPDPPPAADAALADDSSSDSTGDEQPAAAADTDTAAAVADSAAGNAAGAPFAAAPTGSSRAAPEVDAFADTTTGHPRTREDESQAHAAVRGKEQPEQQQQQEEPAPAEQVQQQQEEEQQDLISAPQPPDEYQQEDQQLRGSSSRPPTPSSFPAFKLTFWPFWGSAGSNRRRLHQTSSPLTSDSTSQQPLSYSAEPTAVPLLPPATEPSITLTSSPSSPSTLLCPAGTNYNSTDGTCVSSEDAFPTGQEAAVISTVTIEAPVGDEAEPAPAREAPIDPGTYGTLPVVVGKTNGMPVLGDRVTRAVAPYTGPVSQVTRTLTMIGNSKIKVGVDLDRAGTISWVSSPLAPIPWKDQNIINIWDQGRLLQQSFYGCVDGSCWATRPWLWNPVQGGSWQNAPGQTTRKMVKTGGGGYIYAEGLGRNWGKQDLVKDLKFTTNVTLLDNVAVVKFNMHYTGTVTHPYMTQEVPAVFVDRKFSVLAYYDGTAPWTNDKAIKYAFPPSKNTYARPTEFWAAFIDPVTGWGLGVYNPMAWMGITAYRIGPDGAESRPWDCSYFAHTIRMQLHPGMKPYPYTIYVTVGRLDTIRATFYKLRTQPSVLAAQATTTAATRSITPRAATARDAANEQPGPQLGQPDLGRNTWYGLPLNYSMFDNVVIDGAVPVGQASAQQGRQGASDGTGAAERIGSGGGQGGRALTPGQFAGVIVGAVGGCVLMAGVVIVRAMQQRRASAASEAELLAAADGVTSSSPTRSPSTRGPRSRAHSNIAAAAAGAAVAAAAAAAASKTQGEQQLLDGRNGTSPSTTASGQAGANRMCEGHIQRCEGDDGAVSVTAVTPEVTTRSAAKLQK